MTASEYRGLMKHWIQETWLNLVDSWDRFVEAVSARLHRWKKRK